MNKSVTPITPVEAKASRIDLIPWFVIQGFNNMIVKNLSGRGNYASFKQDAVVKEILDIANAEGETVNSNQLFQNKWLDIEHIFEKAGWKAEYDKPGYNESGDAYFKFSAK